jgi:KUP system potassium uptake protein
MTTSHSMPAAATAGHPAKWVGLTALGVVFGDLGTSPLYTLQTVVQAMGGRFTPASAVGILSPQFGENRRSTQSPTRQGDRDRETNRI